MKKKTRKYIHNRQTCACLVYLVVMPSTYANTYIYIYIYIFDNYACVNNIFNSLILKTNYENQEKHANRDV